ncbi:cell division protein FtsL [Cohnella faecalis]|nr:cell division protein FtsL [Cohnella faecalis]
MAYYGNLALRPERAPEETVKPVRETYKVVKKRQLPIGEKLLYLLTVAVLVIVACVILNRYAQIYEMNRTIQQQKAQVEQLTTQTKELQREVERLSDPERISDFASKQLGMVKLDQQGITIAANNGRTAIAAKPQG